MLEQITDFMRRLALPADAAILVGVSGGPDSLVLLDVLRRLGQPVLVAHFDHHLRPESGQEAAFVADFASRHGLKFVSGEADTLGYARQKGLSIEEAARILRYQFLFRSAQEIGVPAVAVAHSADDQVETVLMHLLRGAGLAGLRGMEAVSLPNEWSQTIALLRPLLGTRREEILAYCQAHDLHPVEDASNQQTKYYRNRIRHELVPLLESYNPAARRLLWQMAESLAQDYQVIAQQVEGALPAVIMQQGEGFLGISSGELASLLPGLQRHVWRRLLGMLLPGLRDVGYEVVLRALEFAAQPDLPQIDLTGGLRLIREGNLLWLVKERAELPEYRGPQLALGERLQLTLPGDIQLQHGWMLSARIVPALEARQQAEHNRDVFQAWLDADLLQQPMQVRERLPGDRITPLGMGGQSIKISDLMINHKLPRRARQNWPLVVSDSEIVWAPGFCLSHHARLQAETVRAVHLRIYKLGE